ncbi:hypothetical protein [Streptomyces sp. SAI-208]|uniref:hypothetical protein n=1 Tax=Streptomyces sp. SAI-208 TaxID=2940550 RepID=UPI0024761BAC|nr:hypothetical protein [Streptomyces sp. SAI-208]
MQLKHAATRASANRWTQGSMDHDPSWARLLITAIAERRFQRLRDLFDADSRGNHCILDENNPVGAKCLKAAIVLAMMLLPQRRAGSGR